MNKINTNIKSTKEDKTIIVLIILLIAFFASKIFTLFTPLFHDEIGVYGRLLFYMYEQGPSMHPADVTPEFGRGHPLFFTYFLSLISGCFAKNYIAARSVVLCLSVLTVYCTYCLAQKLTDAKTAAVVSILLIFQPIFYAQSTMILPEIMLSLLGLLCLITYINQQYWLYCVMASLLLLTKETGVVVLGTVALNEWKKSGFSFRWKPLLHCIRWLAPLCTLLLFFVIQKQAYGWYLYPFHTSLISFNPATVLIRFALNFSNLFLDQGRFLLFVAFIYSSWKMGRPAFIKLIDRYFLLLAYIGLMLLFSSLNYVMTRYLLLILPASLLFLIIGIQPYFSKVKYLFAYLILSLPFQFSFLYFRQDNDMGYLIVVENMQQSIAKLDELTKGKPAMIWAQFPELNALDFRHDGYVKNPNYVLRTVYKDSIDYILISDRDYLANDKLVNNMEYQIENKVDSILNDSIAFQNSGFELVYEKVLFFNRQRIFRTNNNQYRAADYHLKVED